MGDSFIGSIMMYSGATVPSGWVPCDGRLLPVSNYSALFSLIGYNFGGSGASFALPDMRGRAVVHAGAAGAGGVAYGLAARGGQENVSLSANQIAPHNHFLTANTAAGTATSIAGAVLAASGTSTNVTTPPAIYGPDTGPMAAIGANSIGSDGGGQGHNNMQPYLAVNFYIALTGLYPSRP